MSAGSNRRLIITIGVATISAAIMYVIVNRRRRKGQQRSRDTLIFEQPQEQEELNASAPRLSEQQSEVTSTVDEWLLTTEASATNTVVPLDAQPVACAVETVEELALASSANADDDDDAAAAAAAAATEEAATDSSMMAQPIITAPPPPTVNNNCYNNAESPSGTSTNSEGSADSGRATGGPNCSPFDHHNQHQQTYHHNVDHPSRGWPVYEFEVANTLVGLIIGVRGKTIEELSKRADVRILIRPHHTPARVKTHQLCSIEGPRNNINMCLHMIRYRFPQARFPDLNLKPILPPTMLDSASSTVAKEPTTLSLPVGVPSEASICNIVDPGHFFVQLPTHPTYSSLANLDYYSANIYRNPIGIPVLPKPCTPGVVCIAPTANGWFRAITMKYNEADDSVIVRLADHGGLLHVARTELRQIRSDLTSLPMQAIECYLAHVQPIDGTSRWSDAAQAFFSKTCASRIVQVELVGHHKESNIPLVVVWASDEKKQARRIDQLLREENFAKPADPARMITNIY